MGGPELRLAQLLELVDALAQSALRALVVSVRERHHREPRLRSDRPIAVAEFACNLRRLAHKGAALVNLSHHRERAATGPECPRGLPALTSGQLDHAICLCNDAFQRRGIKKSVAGKVVQRLDLP